MNERKIFEKKLFFAKGRQLGNRTARLREATCENTVGHRMPPDVWCGAPLKQPEVAEKDEVTQGTKKPDICPLSTTFMTKSVEN